MKTARIAAGPIQAAAETPREREQRLVTEFIASATASPSSRWPFRLDGISRRRSIPVDPLLILAVHGRRIAL